MDEVWEATPGAREAILSRRCAGNEALRADIEAWLAGMQADEPSLLDAPVHAVAPDLLGTLPWDTPGLAHRPPPQIGPWRLIEQVGRGGTGVVWRAVRADGAYDQTVALKLLWGRRPSPDLERRFATERQILASLEHPNIARLIDGGVVEGVPYLVMEYVDGRPITTWCEVNGASLEARLDLFISVCEAVGYAHRSLVVHRDLKPSNILVTGQGLPKIVDFGVAKLLVDNAAGSALETRVPMWTPAYAAPEQIRGEAVTTATDVWALGATLYRMLTGEEARHLEGLSPSALEIAASTDPPAPSAHANMAPGGIPAKRIAGDLDAIVTTAMRSEPESRYAGGTDLAADLRRHRANLPVRAREPSAWYRVRKFTRRNRLAVAVATLFVLMGGFYGVTLRLQADRLAAERDRARLESAKVEATMGYLGDLILAAGPFQEPGTRSTGGLIDVAITRVDSAFLGNPEMRADVLRRLGMTAYWMGELGKAREIFRHLAVTTESAGTGRIDPVTRWYAQQYLAAIESDLGRYASAEAIYERVLADHLPALGPRSPYAGATRNALGWLYHETGQLDRAEANYRLALDIRREARGPESVTYATTLENLGLLLADRGDLEAAETLVRAAFDIRSRAYGGWHVNTAYSLRSLGRVLHRQGRVEEAESLLRTATSMRRRLLGPDHHKYAEDLAALATVTAERGDLTEARNLLREALGIREVRLGHVNALTAVTVHQLAAVHHRLGEVARADSLYRSALDYLAPEFGSGHPWALGAREDRERLGAGLPPLRRPWLSGTRLLLPAEVDSRPIAIRSSGAY